MLDQPDQIRSGHKVTRQRRRKLPIRPDRLLHPELEGRITRHIDLLNHYLDDKTFYQKLDKATFKDLMVAQAVLVDKLNLVQGNPTTIVGHQDRAKLDVLLPKLMAELSRRGLTLHATQQTATITLPPTDHLGGDAPDAPKLSGRRAAPPVREIEAVHQPSAT